MTNLPTRTRYEVTLRGRQLPKYFIPEEVHLILASLKGQNFRRDHLIINMLWQTGARVSELLAIRPIDIDPHAKGIKIITLKQKGKGQKFYERFIPVDINMDDRFKKPLLIEIEEYIEEKDVHPSDRLFSITPQRIRDIIVRTCRRAKIDRGRSHPHTFRHSFAVNLVKNRVPTYTIQQLMGHSDPASTYVYVQLIAADSKQFMEGIKW